MQKCWCKALIHFSLPQGCLFSTSNRFLDEVQSYSGVNKMSVQNLATVFGPNILRPKVEDPLTIMEGKLKERGSTLQVGKKELLLVNV